MDELTYRRALLARLLRTTGAGSLGAAFAATMGMACGSTVTRSGTGTASSGHGTTASSGGGGASTASSSASTGGASTASTSASTGGASTASTSASAGGAGGGGGASPDAGSCGPVQVCFPPVDAGACPTNASLIGMQAYLTGCPGTQGQCPQIEKVLSGPFVDGGTDCCYVVEGIPIPCYVGRTFFIDEGTVKAELRRGRSWLEGPRPEVDALPAATRRALGEAWARDGLFEHASVASFSRFSMELLALGAPADLVRDTHAACVDEVRHAELCMALASAYIGHDVEPSRLPITSAVDVGTDLAAVAAEAALEGCVGETVAAVQAHASLLRATDPAVREVLAVTVEDETRHAELAWRFLAWALDTGGHAAHPGGRPGAPSDTHPGGRPGAPSDTHPGGRPGAPSDTHPGGRPGAPSDTHPGGRPGAPSDTVRERVMRAFAGFRPAPPTPENLEGVDLALFEAHGRMVASEARAIADRALAEVVRPCLCALLEKRGSARAAGPRPSAQPAESALV